MSPRDPEPKDPRKGRRPKDSEFYQIPPDLKKEFDIIMSERASGSAAVEDISKAVKARKRLATTSLVFGVLGGVLIGVGPALAIFFGLLSRRTGKGVEGIATSGLEGARFGIFLGVLMIPVNIVTLLFIFGR